MPPQPFVLLPDHQLAWVITWTRPTIQSLIPTVIALLQPHLPIQVITQLVLPGLVEGVLIISMVPVKDYRHATVTLNEFSSRRELTI